MHVTPMRYLDEKERTAITARNRIAFRETLDKICAELGRIGISYERKDYSVKQMNENPWTHESGYLASADGFDMSLYFKIVVPLEHGHPECAGKWSMKSAIRVQIGNRSTNLVRFVESKKGFDYNKIAHEIVAWVAARREADKAYRRHLVERRNLEEAVEVLNKEHAVRSTFPGLLDRWDSSHPMAEPGSGGMIKVCLPDMRIDKAEAVLGFARKLGL